MSDRGPRDEGSDEERDDRDAEHCRERKVKVVTVLLREVHGRDGADDPAADRDRCSQDAGIAGACLEGEEAPVGRLPDRPDDVRLRSDRPRRLRPHSGEAHDESFPVLPRPVLEMSTYGLAYALPSRASHEGGLEVVD